VLGRDHALLGAVGYLVAAPMILHDPSWQVLGVGAVTSAAFALLPDIDEPGSTVSRKLGIISQTFSGVVRNVSGGHRAATHSIFFAAIVALLTRLALLNPFAVGVMVAAGVLLVFRMLLPMALRWIPLIGLGTLVLAFLFGTWARHLDTAARGVHPPSMGWLMLATTGGVLLHLVGDSLTIEGVPWLWLPMSHPLQRFHIKFPLVGHTGSARESLIGSLMALALVWMTWHMILVPGSHDMTRIVAHALPHFNPVGWVKSWLPHLHVPKPGQIVKTLTH
jgi:membrane-bound metal-dependent hydrolase YbcI (DUF457 family)